MNLSLIELYSSYTCNIVSDTYDCGIGWGRRYIAIERGNITISEFFVISTQPYNSRVLLVGDSFVEGNSLYNENKGRWAYLLKESLNGSVFINGQSGAGSSDGVLWMEEFLFDIVDPQYCIFAFGMNDGDYDLFVENINRVVKLCEARGCIPIFMTISASDNPQSGNEIHMKMNDYIRSSGYRFIDAAALSIGNDGLTPNHECMLDDGVHPSLDGMHMIYEQILKDAPYIFE